MVLQALDYVVIAGFYTLSVAVGLYHAVADAIKERRRSANDKQVQLTHVATEEYLLGGRKLPLLPTTLSMISSFLSGILLLAVPADIFNRGVYTFMYLLAGAFSFPLTAWLIVPRFYAFKLASIYEFFEIRFGGVFLRRLTSTLFLLSTLIYMSITIYAPSIAIDGMFDAPFWLLAAMCGGVCTLYTALGGLKAVVWTDTLQAGIMYLGLATLVVKGTVDAGGPGRVWQVALQSGRLDALSTFDPDPQQYMSVWIALFAGSINFMAVYGLNQMSQQRYCNLPSCRQAQVVVGLSGPGFVLMATMASSIGLIMLAYYNTCPPPDVSTVDQYVLRFSIDVLGWGIGQSAPRASNVRVAGDVPGLMGVFMVTLFSGTLSTVSSGINSMSAVIWLDFVQPLYPHISDGQAKLLNMALVLLLGLAATCLTFLCILLKGLLNTVIVLVGAIAGPVTGLFLYALFVPRANRLGGTVGIISGCIVIVLTAAGHIWLSPYDNFRLPPDAGLCLLNATATANATGATEVFDDQYGVRQGFFLFRMSPYAYTLLSSLVVLGVGTAVGWLPNRYTTKTHASQVKLQPSVAGTGMQLELSAYDNAQMHK